MRAKQGGNFTIFTILFDMTRPGREPLTYRTRGEHAYHLLSHSDATPYGERPLLFSQYTYHVNERSFSFFHSTNNFDIYCQLHVNLIDMGLNAIKMQSMVDDLDTHLSHR